MARAKHSPFRWKFPFAQQCSCAHFSDGGDGETHHETRQAALADPKVPNRLEWDFRPAGSLQEREFLSLLLILHSFGHVRSNLLAE
jgi:hypothetical protein